MRLDFDAQRKERVPRVIILGGREFTAKALVLRDLELFDGTDHNDLSVIRLIITRLFGEEDGGSIMDQLEIEELHQLLENLVPGSVSGALGNPRGAVGSGSPSSSPEN